MGQKASLHMLRNTFCTNALVYEDGRKLFKRFPQILGHFDVNFSKAKPPF